jgi:polyhydroxyalkanoate synthesis regulator phasin
MEDFFRKAMQFGLGLVDFTREKVEGVVEEMVRRGELSQQDKSGAIAQIMEKAQAEQEALKEKIIQAVAGMGLARAQDLENLEKRVAALEAALQARSS